MKRLLTLLFVVLGCWAGHAEYLQWQVSAGDISGDGFLSGLSLGDNAFAVVRYGDMNNKNYSSWTIAKDMEYGSEDFGTENNFYEGTKYSLSDLEGWEMDVQFDASGIDTANLGFYIEIWRYAEGKTYAEGVARSKVESYDSLSGKGYTFSYEEQQIDAGIWHGSAYSIPEPTSAMLLMIGLSLVGLKRKRA